MRGLKTLRIVLIIMLLAPVGALAERTRLKPGRNAYTPTQDIELGRQAATEVEQQMPMLDQKQVDDYLNRLGRRLAGYAPGEKFPYQFKCVNDAAINAFALPGGFLFVNRGTIEAADNEAELAGVIGHEIGHVALRHGTNQVTRQQQAQGLAQLGSILASIFIEDETLGTLAQQGIGFGANSALLKYSRDAEREADLLGTQILYDAGYEPQYMARFFEKLAGERGIAFFSSHPNPDDRMKKIGDEIKKLGRARTDAVSDSTEFHRIKKYVQSLPPAPNAAERAKGQARANGGTPATASTGRQAGQSAPDRDSRPGAGRSGQQTAPDAPPRPSSRFTGFASGYISLRYPDNWQTSGRDQDFVLVPERGVVNSGQGAGMMAYGVTVAVQITGNRRDLKIATNQLADRLRKNNPRLQLSRDRGRIQVAGMDALSRLYANSSPLGGREIDWIVTTLRPEGLVYFIFVAPEDAFPEYQPAFQKILDSVEFQ